MALITILDHQSLNYLITFIVKISFCTILSNLYNIEQRLSKVDKIMQN